MVQNQLLVLPNEDKKGRQMDVSHLCHQGLCPRTKHLVYGTHKIDIKRKHFAGSALENIIQNVCCKLYGEYEKAVSMFCCCLFRSLSLLVQFFKAIFSNIRCI